MKQIVVLCEYTSLQKKWICDREKLSQKCKICYKYIRFKQCYRL